MDLFSFRKLFCNLFLLLLCFLGMVREKGGGKGGQGEDPWSVKYKSSCSKDHHKFKCMKRKCKVHRFDGALHGLLNSMHS